MYDEMDLLLKKESYMKTKSRLKGSKVNRQSGLLKERAVSYKVKDMESRNILPYSSFEAKNFRCFDNFKIDSFKKVNLITGINNSGKTTLLEALFLLIGATNPSLTLIINGWRGLDIVTDSTDNQWSSLFWRFKDSESIKLMGKNSEETYRSLEINIGLSGAILRGEKQDQEPVELIKGKRYNIIYDYVDESGKHHTAKGVPVFVKKGNMMSYELRLEPSLPRPSITGIFINSHHIGNINEEMQRFSDVRREGKDGMALEAAKIIEPRLERLEILTYQGIPMIHGYLKGYDEPVPSPLLGDGVRRSLTLLLAIGAAKNGVVLVDEIENGIHHSTIKSLWGVIAGASRTFNCQVFATTHSEECIYAAHDAFRESKPYDLMLYRLDRKNGSIYAVKYDEEKLDAALSIPLEVRGWPEE